MRLLSEALVDRILPIDIAIDSAVDAFEALSDGTAKVPLRGEIYQTDPKGTVLVMPGMVGKDILGVKLVGSVVDQTMAGGKHAICMMMIWDARNLRVRGLIAAGQLNEHRTAAGFAAATLVASSVPAISAVLRRRGVFVRILVQCFRTKSHRPGADRVKGQTPRLVPSQREPAQGGTPRTRYHRQ